MALSGWGRGLGFLGAALLAAALAGCETVGGGPGADLRRGLQELDKRISQATGAEFRLSERLVDSPPKRVAVLPFINKTTSDEAFEIVRRTFYNHFSSQPYEDIEIPLVDRGLLGAGFYDPRNPAKLEEVHPRRLGEALRADAVIYGDIVSFDRVFAAIYSQVSVGLRVRMVSTKDGALLWESSHVSKKHAGGIPVSPWGAVAAIVSAGLNMRQVELLRAADDVGREMVATLPKVNIPGVVEPPPIFVLLHTGHCRPVEGKPGAPARPGEECVKKYNKAGDLIEVAMKAEPGKGAYFDLGEVRKNIAMQEVQPGVYKGQYQVVPGDNVQGAAIVGRIIDGTRVGEWLDALGTVDLDTKPPDPPQDLRAVGRNALVQLAWRANDEKDLAGYRVFRSETPLAGFRPVGTTQFTRFEDKGLTNFKTYFYKLAALDRAGNESPPSDPAVEGVPVKPGPTPVGGEIASDTIWYQGASPYVLREEVVVLKNATLKIEPGTRILSGGPGIRVRGKLIAKGEPGNLILMEPREEGKGVVWKGLYFDNTTDAESKVEYAKIKGARVAVEMVGSSPSLVGNDLIENDVGIQAREFSNPVIEKNRIRDNKGHGIVLEKADPTIRFNEVTLNGGHGIFLTASNPTISHNNIVNNKGKQVVIDRSAVQVVALIENWWGVKDRDAIENLIEGPKALNPFLDAPYPKGRPVQVAALQPAPLPGAGKPPAARPGEAEAATPPPPPPDVAQLVGWLQDGERFYQEGKLDLALDRFTRLLPYKGKDPVLRFRLGVIHYEQRRLEEAMAHISEAVRLHPDFVPYRYSLGLVYSEAGQMEKAQEQWREVLKLNPNHKNARALLTWSLEQQKKKAQR